MSIQCGELCAVIIKQYFGENAQKVADLLFSSGSRSLSSLVKATNLTKAQVSELHYMIVTAFVFDYIIYSIFHTYSR